jgi:hypothetical protein
LSSVLKDDMGVMGRLGEGGADYWACTTRTD